MGNKATIEICKAQERLYIPDCWRYWPVSYSCYFDWVHGEGSWFDYHPKVFNFGDIEGAFLQFQIEVEFLHVLKDLLGSLLMVLVVV